MQQRIEKVVEPVLVPYYHFNRRGSKRHLLDATGLSLWNRSLEEPEGFERGQHFALTRRSAMKLTASAIAAGAGLRPARTEAGFWFFLAQTVFSAAVGWLVGRILDKAFPDTPKGLGLTATTNPQPTKDAFHN